MVPQLSVSNSYHETLNFGYTLTLMALFCYVHFIFLSHLNRVTLKALAMATPSLITTTLSSPITQISYASFCVYAGNVRFKV
jgi:hypothetical protein